MTRSLSFALALVLAAASLKAQTAAPMKNAVAPAPASAQHETSACANLHQLMQSSGHAQLDSAQMAQLHAHIQEALASGVSIDSVHKALMAHLSGEPSAKMKLTADQVDAIKACVVSVQHDQSAKQR